VKATPRLRKLKITKHDNRYQPPKAYRAVECEALKQKVLLENHTQAPRRTAAGTIGAELVHCCGANQTAVTLSGHRARTCMR
jgi:hypothetical protein